MKKFVLLFTILFTVSSSFISCRDREQPETDELVQRDGILDIGDEDMTDDVFGEFDANEDDQWDENEFAQANDIGFAEWDKDNESSLSEDEFYNTVFGYSDMDNDDRLNEDEWNNGYSNMYGTYADQGDFDVFDKDEDGFLSSDEWNMGFSDSEWFNSFDEDRNEFVDDSEWSNGLFSAGDANEDGFWDQNEYNRYTMSRTWS